MKFTLYLLLLISWFSKSYGHPFIGSPSGSFDSALVKNASVLKDEENIVLEISGVDRFTYSVHQVITVLNEKGREELDFVQYTNKYIALEDADIEVYDISGKQTNRFRKKDMTTVSDGDGLIEDGYVTYFRVTAPSYPITVEYNYRLKFTGTVFYPSYDIMSSGEAVLKSTFTARVLKDLDLRYKNKNVQLHPLVTEEGKYKQYQWSVSDMKALDNEEGATQYDNRYPSVQLAPNKFSYYGHEGELTSWKKFGEWINILYRGLDELPPERKDFFINLVKGSSSDKEKAKIIYNYLQKNFRYVSIQLGIGGLKPFSADFTDQKKYGDCKGLCNYMKAALKAVGIKSYLALINAEYNSEPVDPTFPENGFNHVILCIPQPGDSVWLECTSNTAGFGVLGSFTENRNALLITEDGGVLVPTPASRPGENVLRAKTLAEISADGSGTSLTTLTSLGSFKDEMEENLAGESKEDQREFLVRHYGFKSPDEFQVARKDSLGLVSTSIKMSMEQLPEFIAGDKMFITPALYRLWSHKLPTAENRRFDFYFPDPFIKEDTTIYKLPEGYKVEALPDSKNLTCPYGSYITGFRFDAKNNAVYCTAKLELTQLKIPALKYALVKEFFDEVLQQESQKIVITK